MSIGTEDVERLERYPILLAQLAEARTALHELAGRLDEFTFQELAAILDDGPTDIDGNDVIAAEQRRIAAATSSGSGSS